MAKKRSRESKPKKGLARLMELAMTHKASMAGGMALSALATIASFLPYLAIYCIIQEIVGAYPDFGALDVPKVLGYGGMALGGVLLNVLLYFPAIREEWASIRTAMKIRGIHVSLEHILVPLLMSAVNVSEELSAAALCRGLDNPGAHTSLVQVKFGRCDAAVWTTTGVLAAAALILKGAGRL